jgi:hypothetical protein
MKIISSSIFGVVSIAILLVGCAEKEEKVVYGKTTTQKGPKFFDNSGTLRCSLGDSLDDVCDYRSIQTREYTTLWVEDVASPDLIRYRVFTFDRKSKKFTARTREPVKSLVKDNRYLVEVGKEQYLISHRSLTKGYKYKVD